MSGGRDRQEVVASRDGGGRGGRGVVGASDGRSKRGSEEGGKGGENLDGVTLKVCVREWLGACAFSPALCATVYLDVCV